MEWTKVSDRVRCAVGVMAMLGVAVSIASAQGAAQNPPAGQNQMPGMRMPATDLGLVSGRVTKAAGGAPAPNAMVTATNTTNGIQYSATTDDEGRFTLPSLAAGTYDIAVQLGGYKPFRRAGLTVTANSTNDVSELHWVKSALAKPVVVIIATVLKTAL